MSAVLGACAVCRRCRGPRCNGWRSRRLSQGFSGALGMLLVLLLSAFKWHSCKWHSCELREEAVLAPQALTVQVVCKALAQMPSFQLKARNSCVQRCLCLRLPAADGIVERLLCMHGATTATPGSRANLFWACSKLHACPITIGSNASKTIPFAKRPELYGAPLRVLYTMRSRCHGCNWSLASRVYDLCQQELRQHD